MSAPEAKPEICACGHDHIGASGNHFKECLEMVGTKVPNKNGFCPCGEFRAAELCANPKCGHAKGWHHPRAGKSAHLSCLANANPGVTGIELGTVNYCPCLNYQDPVSGNPETETRKGETSMAEKKSKPKTYKLSNGREYLPRALGGYDNDVEGLRDLIKTGHHVLLLGDPGTGKTALHMAAFPDSENDIGHQKLTAWDMLWRPRMLPDGNVVYDPSPLTRAALAGKPYYLDEAMRLNDDAYTPLFSAMDGRGFIVGGNQDGTDLPVKPGFAVVAASNPLVRGAFLPDAIASRFHILTVETSEDLLERLELDDRLLVIWRNLTKMEGGETWRPSIRDMLAAQKFIDADNMPQAAYALTGWRVPARDRETVAGVVSPLLGVRVSDLGGIIK